MKKLTWAIIILVIVIAVGIGGYFSYQHWKQGTPEYSLKQLQSAVIAHDTVTAFKYADPDAITNAMWPRLVSNALALPNYSSAVAQAELNNGASSTATQIEQSFYQYVRGDGNTTYVGEILNGLFALSSKKITITGSTAEIPVNLQIGDYNYSINIVLTRQTGNYWMITDMQGLELPVGSNTRDAQRLTDIENIGNGLSLYYEKNGNYPTAITSWSDLEKALIGAGEGAVNLENDPLSGTDYPYYYGSNASGSISVLGLVFEDPSQPIMLSSYTGNLTTGVTWLTGTLPEPCGTATTFCAEEQSNSVLVKG